MDILNNLDQYFKGIKRYPFSIDNRLRTKVYKERMQAGIEIIEALEKAQGLTCVCSKGCNACCCQLITVYSKEAEMAAEYLNSIVKGNKREKLKKKISDQVDLLARHEITEEAVKVISDMGGEDELTLKENYVALNIPCPLLTEDGHCMIYPVRPVSCWDYRCYGSSEGCKGQISHTACSNEKISVPLTFDLLNDRNCEESYDPKLFQTELLKHLHW